MKHGKAQIALYPKRGLYRHEQFDLFLQALDSGQDFRPDFWHLKGDDYSQIFSNPFDVDAITSAIAEKFPNNQITKIGLSLIKGVERYSDQPDDYNLYLSSKLNQETPFNEYLPKAYLDLCAETISEEHQERFFLWADSLAVALQPAYGMAHLFADPIVSRVDSFSELNYCENIDYPFQWQSETEKQWLWMRKSSELINERYPTNGPVGLGLRTYFGGDILALFGREFLLQAPGFVRELPWGGISIDLCQKPWEKEKEELLTSWSQIMAYLQQAEVMCKPVFAEAGNRVFFTPGEKWKQYREKHEEQTPTQATGLGRNDIEQKMVDKSAIEARDDLENPEGMKIINGILGKAGWYPGRQISIHDIQYILGEAGYTLFPAAERFLMEYGMLRLFDESIPWYPTISTDFFKDLRPGNSRVKQLENLITHEPLALIGEYDNGDQSQDIFIGESGAFYLLNDNDYVFELSRYERGFKHLIMDTMGYEKFDRSMYDVENWERGFTLIEYVDIDLYGDSEETADYVEWVIQQLALEEQLEAQNTFIALED